jgi:hypothetical protein
MISAGATLSALALAITVVLRRCTPGSQGLLAGTLPILWITLCALAGVLSTLAGVSPQVTLGLAIGALFVLACLPKKENWHFRRPGLSDLPAVLGIGCALGCAFAVCRQAQTLEPWGSWDTMFTWVLRARFLDCGSTAWVNTFSNDLALLHPDYPPLLAWALLALWQLDGTQTPSAIAWLCWPVGIGFGVLVWTWPPAHPISARRRLMLVAAVLLGTPILWKLAASRLSDFILSAVILASGAWWQAGSRSTAGKNHWLITGFLVGLAGLVKNEGALWGLAVCMALIGALLRGRLNLSRAQLQNLALGAALPVAALILFKLVLAPPSDLVAPQRTFEIGEIVQPGTMINPTPLLLRVDQVAMPLWHLLIWKSVWSVLCDLPDWGGTLWLACGLCLYRLIRRQTLSPLCWAVSLQLAGYYLVYLLTPYHPYWHLSTSLSRILVHIVPVAVCLLAWPPFSFPERTPQAERRLQAWHSWGAALVLGSLAGWNWSQLSAGDWKLGQQPNPDLQMLSRIEFPPVTVASYVTDQLGIRDVYATQFEAVPTILVIDRREKILLARFATEQALQAYCREQHWTLEHHSGGLGWARDAGRKDDADSADGTGPEGLPQPVIVPRLY